MTTMADIFAKCDNMHFTEKSRIQSFNDWPFDDSSSCSFTKMAEAGFYWSGNKNEKDTVTCFCCGKTLDGWESTDDPWTEHAKHAPQCAFVKNSRKEADLTVEEYLNLLSIVLKNKMQKRMEKAKKDLTSYAEKNLDKYIVKLNK